MIGRVAAGLPITTTCSPGFVCGTRVAHYADDLHLTLCHPMSRNWRLSMPSPESYQIDRVLYDVQHKADHREQFQTDPHAYLRAVPLSPERKAELAANDFGALYVAGANPYLLRAHCLVMKISEQNYLAQMRAVTDSP